MQNNIVAKYRMLSVYIVLLVNAAEWQQVNERSSKFYN